MLGPKKARQESLFSPVRRETRVSKELKELKEFLDFDWLRKEVEEKFASCGRPSIAPEVLGAMVFLGFWFGIPSDRELCEECEDRLSFREFIGISDEDEVPVHSSLTHWRTRLGREIFQKFLKHSLELAVSAGLKLGRCRMFDASMVKAQAGTGKSKIEIDPVVDANDYLDALGHWEEPQPQQETEHDGSGDGKDGPGKAGNSGKPLSKSDSKRLNGGKPIYLCANDLDARYLSRRGMKASFQHKTHFEFDASSELVVNADAGHVADHVKMMEFLDAELYAVDTVVADTGYFEVKSQEKLKSRGVCSLISVRDNSNNGGRVFGIDAYVYLADSDEYVCPEGKRLTRQGTSAEGERRYATARGSCAECEMRPYCFQGKRMGTRRQLTLCAGRELVEEARKRNLSNRYRRLKVKRSIICEGSFGTMKSHYGFGRARWLGEEAMAIQALMCGMVHNLKKLMKFRERMREAAKAAQMSPSWAFAACSGLLLSSLSLSRTMRRMGRQILPQSAWSRRPQLRKTQAEGY